MINLITILTEPRCKYSTPSQSSQYQDLMIDLITILTEPRCKYKTPSQSLQSPSNLKLLANHILDLHIRLPDTS